MGLNLCSGCKKMLYRQDACRRTSGECKRKDGGPTAAPSPNGKAAAFDAASAGSSPAGATKSKKPADPETTPGNRKPAGKGGRRTDPAPPAEKRGRGRPQTITDLKAYKADKARKYRAAKKAEANNAKK